MHVLKSWELAEPLQNIDKVIKKARKRKILNEHENNYVETYKRGSLNESRKLMEMVSCYGDQLETFLEILNETENKQLARRLREKKNEFVFMIREKESLDVEGGRNHRSLLPSSLPTQFIYESTVEDVIDKIKEKYECRKPIADIFYIVIVCKNLSKKFIDCNKEDEISRFLINIYNIFGESKEIKIIANVEYKEIKKDVSKYFLPFSIMGSMEMYIMITKDYAEEKDLHRCVNVSDTLKKASKRKVKFCESYMYIILKRDSGRKIPKMFETLTEGIRIESETNKNAEEVEKWVDDEIKKKREKRRDVELMSKIKQITIFFAEEFWKVGEVSGYINTLFEKFSGFERVVIVIQNSKKDKEENELKNSEWKKKPNVTIYETDKNQWIDLKWPNEQKISVDYFLSEYCSKIE